MQDGLYVVTLVADCHDSGSQYLANPRILWAVQKVVFHCFCTGHVTGAQRAVLDVEFRVEVMVQWATPESQFGKYDLVFPGSLIIQGVPFRAGVLL